jgi:hypothetical protein
MNWKTWPYWVKGCFWGAFLSFLVWFYDYDFLLNFGGPTTPISDYIRSLFGIIPLSNGAAFFPLKILMPLGGLAGIIFGWLYGKIKNWRKPGVNSNIS